MGVVRQPQADNNREHFGDRKETSDKAEDTMDLSTAYSNGVVSPRIQLGTFRIKKAEDVNTAVSSALSTGYRAIDTAEVYRNHCKLATALKEALPSLGLTREDIFITSKLAPKDHGVDKCDEAVGKVLKDLETDYLDLFLLHWPGVQKLDVEDPLNRKLRAESWKVLEKDYKEKKFRSIGVSNYTLDHMKELLENCEIVPHVLQIELHPPTSRQSLSVSVLPRVSMCRPIVLLVRREPTAHSSNLKLFILFRKVWVALQLRFCSDGACRRGSLSCLRVFTQTVSRRILTLTLIFLLKTWTD